MDLVPEELRAAALRWGELSRDERIRLARRLRACGLSLTEISETVPMSKPTLSVWCRGVELTPNQQEAIKDRTAPRRGVRRDTQRKRRVQIGLIEERARHYARAHRADAFFIGGTALYWAEGAKTNRRLQMANSDPRLLSFFIEWVRTHHDRSAQFVLSLNLHADNDLSTAERFWSGHLPLDRVQFTKAFIKPDGTGHRKNHLAYGVCRVTARRSTDWWLRTMVWIDEMAGGGWYFDVATLPLGR